MKHATLLLAGAALAATAAPAGAQTLFGNACAGQSGLVPTLQNVGLPIVGDTWQLEISGVPSGFGYLLVGLSNSFSPLVGSTLPVDLGTLLADPAWAGCDLNIDPGFLIQTHSLDALGKKTLLFPGFPPGSIYFQWLGLDPDFLAFSKIAGLSQGLEMEGRLPSGVDPGDLVITEISKDTSFAFDSQGEWIELYNTTGSAIDIEGFVLRDDDGDTHTIDAAGFGVVVPAGGYITLGIDGDCTLNGGINHAYVYSGFFMSNGSDEVVLEDFNQIVIDAVAYDNGVTFPDDEGATLSLDPTKLNAVDNDDGANWSSATCPLGVGCGFIYATDLGTPGADNGTCTTPPPPVSTGAVVFVEVMKDPLAADDLFGEWFEIVNATGAAVDLDGYTFASGLQVFTVAGPLVVPAGGRQLFMRDNDALDNGGIDGAALGAYEYDPNGGGLWNMGNGAETLQVFDSLGALVGRLAYDDGVLFPDDEGVAFGLDPAVAATEANTDDGANWCNQSSVIPGGTDLGTPGAANDACIFVPACLGSGEIIVTEFMQNPSAVGDGVGEWIEIHNTTAGSIDIEGWILRDNDTDSHVIDNGGSGVFVPAGGYLVLGVSGDTFVNGGVNVGYVYSGVNLGNSDDEIVLENGAGVVCCVEYDNGATFPDGNGAAAQLDPTKLDVASAADGANWSLATTPFGAGDLGTPGSVNP
jgi:hypothetical protein